MGLFSSKPKGTVLDVIDVDLSVYPDDTFTQEHEVNASGNNITEHYGYFDEGVLVLNLFSQLKVITFENSTGKNFIFRCPAFEEFKKSALSQLVNDIYCIYGTDQIGMGRFTSDDWDQIKDEAFWLGRGWTDEKYEVGCSLGFDEEEGLSFTIWTK